LAASAGDSSSKDHLAEPQLILPNPNPQTKQLLSAMEVSSNFLGSNNEEPGWGGYTPVIPAHGRLREEGEFKASLGYTVRPCLKKKQPKILKMNSENSQSYLLATKGWDG
jgi:hypothetical protein